MYPPATKWAHGFVTWSSCFVVVVPLRWILGITSAFSRDCVNEASLESGVGPWICAGAKFPKACGMVMKRRQPRAKQRG